MKENVSKTTRRLQRYLGVTGIFLPIVLFVMDAGAPEQAISKYYYSPQESLHPPQMVLFLGAVVTFGLFLIAYVGHEPNKNPKGLSDKWLTTIAGIFALGVAFFPTMMETYSELDYKTPGGHDGEGAFAWVHTVHMVSAVLFFVLNAILVFVRFAKTSNRARYWVYKTCGLGMILSLIYTAMGLEIWGIIDPCHVFYGESLALMFFGVAWLVKSKYLVPVWRKVTGSNEGNSK